MNSKLKTIGETKIFPVITESGVVVLAIASVILKSAGKNNVNVCYCIPEMPNTKVDETTASHCFNMVKSGIYEFAESNNAVMGGY